MNITEPFSALIEQIKAKFKIEKLKKNLKFFMIRKKYL